MMGSLFILVTCMITAGVMKRRWRRRPSSVDGSPSEQFNALARELVHELRNPLNSINLNLQLLEEDLSTIQADEASDMQKRARHVRSEIGRLDQILTDFRRFARLPPLSFESCDPRVLIEEVLEFTEPDAQRQNIEVIREIHELPAIMLDPDQFKQALWNLIINANQAMEDGGTLTVRAKALNGDVQIDVEDTGEGIDPKIEDRIFDLFFYTKKDGTGVGLAIVKRVVEGHGGRVNVESRLDEGTTFSIILPVHRQSGQ